MVRSIAVSLLALIAGGALVPHARASFQATPAPETGLTPIVWQWTALELSSGTPEAADDPARYTVQFLPDGRYFVLADCNRGSGLYTQDGSNLQLMSAAITLMACPEESQADVFLARLTEIVSFTYEEDELVLALAADAGVLRFRPSLTGVVWEWQRFQGGDGAEVVPDDPTRYTVQFLEDGTVAVLADCNQGTGSYTVDGSQIAIDQIITTLVGCPPGSLGTEFLGYLDEAVTYVVREGKLALALPADAGIAEFAPRAVAEDAATPVAG